MLDRTPVRNYSHVLVRRSLSHLVGTVHPRSGGQHPGGGSRSSFPHWSAGSPAHTDEGRTDMAVEREKALEMALGQIEKQYGKGSVMKMGEKTSMDVESIPTGALSLDIALGHRRPAPRPCRSRSSARSPRASPPWPCTSWPRPSATAASAPTSTPSTRWIPTTPPASASTSTSCSSPSPTPASRPSRSPTCSCAPARSTSS